MRDISQQPRREQLARYSRFPRIRAWKRREGSDGGSFGDCAEKLPITVCDYRWDCTTERGSGWGRQMEQGERGASECKKAPRGGAGAFNPDCAAVISIMHSNYGGYKFFKKYLKLTIKFL